MILVFGLRFKLYLLESVNCDPLTSDLALKSVCVMEFLMIS